MAVWDKFIVWSMFLLAGAASVGVNYPDPVCAVKGSTVTLPCTFTPLKSFTQNGKEVQLQIIRVRWCVNHPICHETTPSVYDSNSAIPNFRYRYLGDLKGNCTLQIRDIQMIDSTIFRFRMEADNSAGHYTEQSGVRVTVTGAPKMRINNSSDTRQLSRNQEVTLHCTADCTFHLLEVTWFKDGNALSQSGPALQLGPLTAKDSGNYTCALKTNKNTISLPYAVHVEEKEEEKEEDEGVGGYLFVGVAFGVLLPLLTLILVLFIIRRKRSAAADKDQTAVGSEMQRHPDTIYSNILQPAEQQEAEHQQEARQAAEDVSYASVQFRNESQARPVEEKVDAVIYSSVASRG